MTNWNNISAHGFGAADDNWGGNGSVARVDMLNRNLVSDQELAGQVEPGVGGLRDERRGDPGRAGRSTRCRSWRACSKGSSAPNAQAATMLKVLIGWRQHGGSRLDRNLDGKIDDPGAAVMDAAWPKIADAFMRPQLGSQLDELDSLFSRFDQPPGGQYDGWYQYFDRDVRLAAGQARGTALPE